MLFEPTTIALIVLAIIVVYQQWIMRNIGLDLDEVIDSHNHMVLSLANLLGGKVTTKNDIADLD